MSVCPVCPAGQPVDQLVVVDQRPRHVQRHVDGERDREQAHDHPHDREPEAGAQAEPALGRLGGGRQHEAVRRDGRRGAPSGRGRSGRPTWNVAYTSRPSTTSAKPERSAAGGSAARRRPRRPPGPAPIAPSTRRMPSTAGPPTASRISSSDHAIGWYTVTTTAASVSAIMISGNSRLPVTALSVGTAIAIQPSTPVTPTRPAMRMIRPERRADEDEDPEGADRVRRHPLRGEREAEQQADRGHQRPEPARRASALDPQPREQQVRREDEEPGVDVVHRDPALDEEHPVEQDEQPDEDPDLAAREQHPGEQEQDADGERAEDHARQAPREVVVPDVDGRGLALGAEREDRARGCRSGSRGCGRAPRPTGRTRSWWSANTAGGSLCGSST